ncbi:MAG: transglutaminase domain-containing protein [bacterium]
MRKIIIILSILISVIVLSGCEIFVKFNEFDLNIKEEKISLVNDEYIFEFVLHESEKYNGKTGMVDCEIKSNSSSLYTKVLDFEVNVEDGTNVETKFTFIIPTEDIKESNNSTGTFIYNIKIGSGVYEEAIEVNGLKLKAYPDIYLENIIADSASTFARENISNDDWSDNNTATDIINMLKFYNDLNEEIEDFMLNGTDLNNNEEFLNFILDDYNLDFYQAYEVYSAVIYDNPIYYFISKTIKTTSYENNPHLHSMLLYVNEEYSSKSVRDYYNQIIEEYFIECIVLVENATTDLEKCLLLHDKIILSVDYNYNFDDWSYNILGVVAKQGPVCESYSETYSMLLTYFDIPCYLVTGVAYQNNSSENHAWNLIQIENKWYWVDVTWNDTGGDRISYKHFGIGKDNVTFNNAHIASANGLVGNNGLMSYMIALPEISTSDLVYTWN